MTNADNRPIINLVTRTCNRPIFFSECQQSIQIQTYPNELIKRYVTFDDEDDLDGYIQKYNNLIVMEMEREKRKNQNHFPYHSYLNEVIKHLGENGSGWVIILDDDVQLANSDSLEILTKTIQANGDDTSKMFIWKCQYNDKVVPSEQSFRKIPKAGDFHISCFAFHTKQASEVEFETKKGAECDVVAKLFNKLTCVWIDKILTQTTISGNGTREDKKEDLKKKISLKPTLPISSSIKQLMSSNIKQLMPSNNKVNVVSTIIDDNAENDDDENEKGDNDEKGNNDNDILFGIDGQVIGHKDENEDENENENEDENDDDDEDEEEEVQNEEDQCNDSDEEVVKSEEIEVPVSVPVSVPVAKISLKQQPKISSVDDNSLATKSTSTPTPKSTSTSVQALIPEDIHSKDIANNVPTDINSVLTGENSHLLIRLVNLLKTGKRVYIFDENNMKKLSKCVFDAITCIDLEDKLINVLERNSLEQKTVELQDKLRHANQIQTNNQTNSQPHGQSSVSESAQLDRQLSSYKSKNSSPITIAPLISKIKPAQEIDHLIDVDAKNYVDKIYFLTDNDSTRNSALERNRKILTKCQYEFEIIRCKDMSLFNYQNQIRDLLKEAKNKGYRRIMILNGNDLLNNKFGDLYEKQVSRIKGDCFLWFLGNNKETPPKDILTTEFDLDDYLFLYEDIVNAKLINQEKAHLHWKTYGYREGRYAKINVVNGSSKVITNNYGFTVSAEIYDTIIELIGRQTARDCKNILSELQTNILDNKTIWYSRPDLVVPLFGNINNHAKNSQLALKMGIYYNFYK